MKIATCNVNGLRAAARKNMGAWLKATNPDILLLQEVRAPEELIADLIGPGYQVFSSVCEIKGRAGVTVAVRDGIEIGDVRSGVGVTEEEPPVDTGRWLEVDLPGQSLTVVSAYLHSGDAKNDEKMAAKYSHLDAVTDRLNELCRVVDSGTSGIKNVLITGDFNIVHTPLDITNWKPNHNRTSGVLDSEIAYLDRWFGELEYVDVQRQLAPDSQGPYSWWSQRGQAFANDVGWRIDYHMANASLAKRARNFRIDRAASYDERFSDHAPVIVEYDL